MSDDLADFLLARIAEVEQRWMRLRDAAWPTLIAVVPSDDSGPPAEGEPMGSVAIGEHTPKRYLRVWKAHRGSTDNIDYGWIYHESAIELLSPEVIAEQLAKCEADRRIVQHIAVRLVHAPRSCLKRTSRTSRTLGCWLWRREAPRS